MHDLVHPLFHPFRVLWTERITLFWPIWTTLTAFGVFFTLWLLPKRQTQPRSQQSFSRQEMSRTEATALIFLLGILACYSAGILFGEEFTYYDDSHFTNGSLIGRPIDIQIAPEQGRFWPLGHQEFNLVGHLTKTVSGYHGFRILELVCVSAFLLGLLKDRGAWARVGLILLALVTPSIIISFSGLIYPEANEILLLTSLAWFVCRFEVTQSRALAIAAVMATQLLLYYKETAFILVAAFAVSRLLMRCRCGTPIRWDFGRLRDPESHLDGCLGLLAVLFVVYYCAAIYPHFAMRYEANTRLPISSAVAIYLQLDLLAWLFLGVCAARTYRILSGRVQPSLVFDGLATAGAACCIVYVILGMVSAYYLAPVDLIAILYLGRIVTSKFAGWNLAIRLAVVTLAVIVLFQDISLAAVRMYERKNLVRAKAEIGWAVKERLNEDPLSVKRLYFPFARRFPILEFASYLNYIGVPVEQDPPGTMQGSGLMLVGKEIQKDGPCGYRAFICHPGYEPKAGDLVIILPDDSTTGAAISKYQVGGHETPIFFYEPHPRIPQDLRTWVNHLHVVSPEFENQSFPDSWLTGSVIAWSGTE